MRHRIARLDKHQGGFTLIELLVVIIILGLLAAVVVFAVRGADDKALENAENTDARIIRTALEAHCAQYGAYPSDDPPGKAMQELVDKRLLSSPSEYHTLATGDSTMADGQGNCNNTRYTLTPERTPTPPPPPVSRACGLADSWCQVVPAGPSLPPNNINNTAESMVQLPNGKVLSIGRGNTSPPVFRTMIYDPAVLPRGQWSDGPEHPFNVDLQFLILITGNPQACTHCGKVLAGFTGMRFALFDPEAPPSGSWQPVTPPLAPPGTTGLGNPKAVQITGACTPHCGKVLITGASSEWSGTSKIYLWDPSNGAVQEVGSYAPPIVRPFAYAVGDGKVLLIDAYNTNKTLLLDVISGVPTLSAGPDRKCDDVYEERSNAGQLTTGRIMLTCMPTNVPPFPNEVPCTEVNAPGPGRYCPLAEIYDAETNDWSLVPSCGHLIPYTGTPQPQGKWGGFCHILASLPDGRVLANSGNGSRGSDDHPDTWLFDPADNKWTKTGPPTDQRSIAVGVYLSGPDCGNVCHSVLAAGLETATSGLSEVYQPSP